jgi:hypothetical protein
MLAVVVSAVAVLAMLAAMVVLSVVGIKRNGAPQSFPALL